MSGNPFWLFVIVSQPPSTYHLEGRTLRGPEDLNCSVSLLPTSRWVHPRGRRDSDFLQSFRREREPLRPSTVPRKWGSAPPILPPACAPSVRPQHRLYGSIHPRSSRPLLPSPAVLSRCLSPKGRRGESRPPALAEEDRMEWHSCSR